MRIRSTKPEFYRSKTIGLLSWSDRHVLKALESYVDDNGVGKDDVTLFAADAFPRDVYRSAPETFRSISQALDTFAELGLIVRYEIDGENLLYVDRWSERQRIDKPSKGRFRRPDGTLEYSEQVDRSSFAKVSGGLPKFSEKDPVGTGEQGNRGTDKTPSSADADGAFDAFWNLYPRKVGKGAAVKAHKAAMKKATADEILEGLRSQLPRFATADPKFIPHAATWLNGERWADEFIDPKPVIDRRPEGW